MPRHARTEQRCGSVYVFSSGNRIRCAGRIDHPGKHYNGTTWHDDSVLDDVSVYMAQLDDELERLAKLVG